MSRTIHRIRALAAAMVATVALAVPTAANAGPLTANAPACSSQTLSQPFLPWADLMSYTLNPGGSFENGTAGWTLSGASVASGNEQFYVTSPGDKKSLWLPSGSSATSAPVCVGIEHPTIRFFAKADSSLAQLSVDVLFEDAAGNVLSAPIGVVTGNTAWAPTLTYPIVANLLPLLPDNHTAVAFRFGVSGGSFRIDDLYVDPYQRR